MLPKPTHYYTASWSPDSKKLLYTDTNVNVWVLDVASGQAKVGRHAMNGWCPSARSIRCGVPTRSGWRMRAGCGRCITRFSCRTSRPAKSKQMTDGLADAVWPAWDASGKYLWFLASTNFGLGIAVARHDVVRPRRDVRAVLRDPEEGRADAAGAGVGRGSGRQGPFGRLRAGRARRCAVGWRRAGPRGRRWRSDRRSRAGAETSTGAGQPSDRFRQHEPAHRRRAGRAARAIIRRCKSGGPGIVFYLETPAGGGATTLQRYRLSDRRAAPFVTGVADYVISADTHKMLYRGAGGGGGGRGGGGGGAAPPVPRSSSSMPIARRRRPARAG